MNKQERRREQKEVVAYLRDALYERDRDYSHQINEDGTPRGYTCHVAEVPVDHEREMLWGDPIGWRVKFGVDQWDAEDQNITLTYYRRDGKVEAEYTYDVAGVGWSWLHATLY